MYAVLALSLSYFSVLGISYLGLRALGRVTAALTNLTLYLTPLISLSLASVSVVGERETGGIEWLLSQPISRSELLLGKYVGMTLATSFATALGYGIAGLYLSTLLPTGDLPKYVWLLTVSVTLGAVSIAVGLLLSVVAATRYEALASSFLIWLVWTLLYDLITIGMIITFNPGREVTLAFFLLNPVEAARLLMIYGLDPNLSFLGSIGTYAAESIGQGLPALASGTMLSWGLLAIALCIVLFRNQDL